jgi:cobalt/nickel transport system permease protein
MHIPDGYLGPSTCVALYGGAAPFWWIALRRMKRALHTRMVPLLSLFSAFSFIVMMFNLPLPGGTTGHAVGVAIATIVLGPWASILAISIALGIQAIFFGDGGITALGANCFNMAVVGSMVSYTVYRAIAGRVPIGSPRRVAAAGIAGYVAINVSALIAAIEFGIQPALYHDASGAPLYAPYPLHIAIPAMMIGHLTIAGLAEMVVSAGVVAYLQRAEPGLLKATAPGAEMGDAPAARGLEALRPLWIALALLMILTPLGILAAGSAWGEWTPQEFAAGHAGPPSAAPAGLQRLSSFWTAPMPRYAPPFLHSPSFGYLLSAMSGTGLIILIFTIWAWFARRQTGS